jgi:glycosyltransferase involved in cell wall biosynthesis
MPQVRRQIHILHFSSQPGGIEVLLPGIIRNIHEYSFSVFVIRPELSAANSIYSKPEINITFGSEKHLPALLKVFKYAKKNKDHIFHVYNIGPYFLFILRLAGVKNLIYSIHGTKYWNGTVQKIIRKLFWYLAVSKRYIFTSNSDYSARVFHNEVLSGKAIIKLYNPIDITHFVKRELPLRKTLPEKIVYVGRLAKGKNLEKWICLAEFLKRLLPETCFQIYGNGPEKEKLQKIIDERELNAYIRLMGHISDPAIAYQEADVLIFLSEYESFGNVVVESIICGTPVIASAIPSMKEIFFNFPEFLVEPDDNLENNILNKLLNFGKLVAVTEKASPVFAEQFDANKHYMELRKLYGSISSKQG